MVGLVRLKVASVFHSEIETIKARISAGYIDYPAELIATSCPAQYY